MRALLLLAFALPLAAVEVAPDAAALRSQVTDVERSIDARFRDLAGAQPMSMLGSARGVYLDGYGAVFTVEINLAPVARLSPFRQSYSAEEKRQLNVRKRQRLEDLEQQARKILAEVAGKLTLIPADETVSLAVSLFYFPWEDLTGLPRQMVAAAKRSAIAGAPAAAIRESLGVRYF